MIRRLRLTKRPKSILVCEPELAARFRGRPGPRFGGGSGTARPSLTSLAFSCCLEPVPGGRPGGRREGGSEVVGVGVWKSLLPFGRPRFRLISFTPGFAFEYLSTSSAINSTGV